MEKIDKSPNEQYAVLDIGDDVGALMITFRRELHGQEIEVSPVDQPGERTHTAVLERHFQRRVAYVALYLALVAGEYTIWSQHDEPIGQVTIVGGEVAVVDWQHVLARVLIADEADGHGHGHEHRHVHAH